MEEEARPARLPAEEPSMAGATPSAWALLLFLLSLSWERPTGAGE